MKTEGNQDLAPILSIIDEIGCSYERLTPAEMTAQMPIFYSSKTIE